MDEQKLDFRSERRVIRSVRYYATQSKEMISKRIDELDYELDSDRYLMATGSSLALGGVLLCYLLRKRNALWLTVVAAGLMFQHALTGRGWIVRALNERGLRSRSELMLEQCALRCLRGDFDQLTDITDKIERARRICANL